MRKKINVALIYKKNYTFFNKEHFDNTTYYFFLKSLLENDSLDVQLFPTDNEFDCRKLQGKIDVILLANNNTDATPEKLIGIKDVRIPVICRTGDPHSAERYNQIEFHEKWKIDYYFNFIHEDYFYEFYPKKIPYKTIIFGLEKSLYQNISPFHNRIKNKILLTGAIAHKNFSKKLKWKFKKPSHGETIFEYKLRTMCSSIPYVDYTPTLNHDFIADKYPVLLQKYQSSIAATTNFPTIKYWEIPAAGCLTFMEITDKNRGKYLGYTDDKNAIFINEKNYEKKFEDYLSDPDNEKWKIIAESGREYAIQNFSNERAVEKLVNLMTELIK